MTRNNRIITKIMLSISSGLLCAATFPPFGQFWLSPVALLPFFLALDGRREKPVSITFLFMNGFLFGLSFFGVGLFWMGKSSWLGWVVLVLLYSPFTALFACMAGRTLRRGGTAPLMFISFLWCFLEMARSHLPGLPFEFLFLGVSLHELHLLLPLARLGGPSALSFPLILQNILFLHFMRAFQIGGPKKTESSTCFLFLSSALWLVVLGWGFYWQGVLSGEGTNDVTPVFRIALARSDADQNRKFTSVGEDENWRALVRLSELASSKNPALLLWPETSFPGIFDSEPERKNWLQAFCDANNLTALVGVVSEETVDGKPEATNSIHCFAPRREVSHVYDKQTLIPGGEYLPAWIEKIIPSARSWVPMQRDYFTGSKKGLFRLPLCQDAVLWECGVRATICSELASFDASRGDWNAMALGCLVNLANENWYQGSAESEQLFALAKFRAVENGVCLFRVSNSGLCGGFGPDGKPLPSTILRNADFPRDGEVHIVEVRGELLAPKGLGLHKNFLTLLCLAFIALAGFLSFVKAKKHD